MTHAVLIVLLVAVCTYLLRALPFLLFRGNGQLPKPVSYLGKVLPGAIMATLVIYCLRSLNFTAAANFVPQLICAVLVVVLHLWRRSTLLSIFGGTAVYMVLVQTVFA